MKIRTCFSIPSSCWTNHDYESDALFPDVEQAVSLLDNLDKELNNYIMRCREY